MFGEIESAELRGDFILVRTAGGRVSFHAKERPHVSNATWRDEHRVRGKMHWHSMKKALRQHCLVDAIRRRVGLHLTNYRFKSGARSSSSSKGWITVDGEIVYRCSSGAIGEGGKPHDLGGALAEYLFMRPEEAVASCSVLLASLALLDRRFPDRLFDELEADLFDEPVWRRFYELRSSFEGGSSAI